MNKGILNQSDGKPQKCAYCGKREAVSGSLYCGEECEKSHASALRRMKKNLKWFWLGIIVSIVFLLASSFSLLPLLGKNGTSLGLWVLAVTMFLFPYCTPETYKLYGYVRTTKIGRCLGVIVGVIGVVLCFL